MNRILYTFFAEKVYNRGKMLWAFSQHFDIIRKGVRKFL